jgi:RND family efflux transporter MFP subunit
MRPGRKRLIGALAILLVVAGAGLGAFLLRRPVEAPVTTVQARTIELALSVVGRARPNDLVKVASPNAGQVVQLLHDDGDAVSAGAALAVVRSVVEQSQTQAELARARAARAETAKARLDFERTRALHDRGFAARAALDAARAALNAAEANLAAADAQVRAAAARAQEFTIRAPMSGVVLVRPIDNGQVVAAGETLFELGSTSGVEIQAEVEEAYADALRPGLAARAALSGSTTVFGARILEVSPKVDASTGGRLIKLVPDDGQLLSPGRSVDVTIVVEERQGALTVPRSAIVDATAAPKVYVADADDKVGARPVTIARWPSVNAIITNGLKVGDRVVLDPASVREGQRIRPITASSDR